MKRLISAIVLSLSVSLAFASDIEKDIRKAIEREKAFQEIMDARLKLVEYKCVVNLSVYLERAKTRNINVQNLPLPNFCSENSKTMIIRYVAELYSRAKAHQYDLFWQKTQKQNNSIK